MCAASEASASSGMHACVQAVHTLSKLRRRSFSNDKADEWLDFLEGVTKVLRTKNRLVFRIPDGSYCSPSGWLARVCAAAAASSAAVGGWALNVKRLFCAVL